ncbi:MAG TPA: class I fructose-bisphosphate aldolase [Candidatus Paceibacterota bacterium]
MRDIPKLQWAAGELVKEGRGILAADESTGTIEKRFAKIGIVSSVDTRRDYREMLFSAPGLGEYISGAIMYDETIKQSSAGGTRLAEVLTDAHIFPGIKVDLGTEALPDSPEEKYTKGLEGLAERLAEYVSLGAVFTKWRAVIGIEGALPTSACIDRNAVDLAKYARTAQEAGLVPIVEPEVLMDGSHTMARCEEVSRAVLTAVFDALAREDVALDCMVLKTNMVVPGKESGTKASPDEVADATLRVFRAVLPDRLAGQAFLSGGQGEKEATANLQAMHTKGALPWPLTFSYGRALQDSALLTWAGRAERVQSAQDVLVFRARMNALASKGAYDPAMER